MLFIFLLLAQMVSKNLGAQTIFSLHDCFKLLENQNEDIRQLNFNLLLGKLEVKEAKNSFLPTLNLGASHNYNLGLTFDQISGQLVTGNKWSNNTNINLSTQIPIFQKFSLRNRLKQSILSQKSKEIQKEQLLQTLKIDVLAKYIETIANKNLYELSLQQLTFANDKLLQEKEKFDLGANTSVDVAQAESSSATNKLYTIVNYASYSSSLIAMKQLLGLPLSDSITLQELKLNETILSTGIIENNSVVSNTYDPFIKNGELSIEQTLVSLKYAKGSYFPSLNFIGGYGTNYSSERTDFITKKHMTFWNQFNQNRNLNFGLSVSMPIFDAFKIKNNISRLKIELESKNLELYKVKTEREKIWLTAIQEYSISVKEYDILQIQLSAQKKNLIAIKELYDIGVSNSIEYNKALLDYNMSESNMIKGKYKLIYNAKILELLRKN